MLYDISNVTDYASLHQQLTATARKYGVARYTNQLFFHMIVEKMLGPEHVSGDLAAEMLPHQQEDICSFRVQAPADFLMALNFQLIDSYGYGTAFFGKPEIRLHPYASRETDETNFLDIKVRALAKLLPEFDNYLSMLISGIDSPLQYMQRVDQQTHRIHWFEAMASELHLLSDAYNNAKPVNALLNEAVQDVSVSNGRLQLLIQQAAKAGKPTDQMQERLEFFDILRSTLVKAKSALNIPEDGQSAEEANGVPFPQAFVGAARLHLLQSPFRDEYFRLYCKLENLHMRMQGDDIAQSRGDATRQLEICTDRYVAKLRKGDQEAAIAAGSELDEAQKYYMNQLSFAERVLLEPRSAAYAKCRQLADSSVARAPAMSR